MKDNMTEQERAAYYQAHKDDPNLWGDAEEGPVKDRRLGVSVTVRFNADDAKELLNAAKAEGVGLSQILREALTVYLVQRAVRGSAIPSGMQTWTNASSQCLCPNCRTFNPPHGIQYLSGLHFQ
jgi:hypothetical protein